VAFREMRNPLHPGHAPEMLGAMFRPILMKQAWEGVAKWAKSRGGEK
jgi:hypothetical protein